MNVDVVQRGHAVMLVMRVLELHHSHTHRHSHIRTRVIQSRWQTQRTLVHKYIHKLTKEIL